MIHNFQPKQDCCKVKIALKNIVEEGNSIFNIITLTVKVLMNKIG